jgi:uncharacterized protein with PQ loop repeat
MQGSKHLFLVQLLKANKNREAPFLIVFSCLNDRDRRYLWLWYAVGITNLSHTHTHIRQTSRVIGIDIPRHTVKHNAVYVELTVLIGLARLKHIYDLCTVHS